MELSKEEWEVLRMMAGFLLDGLEGDLEADGYVRCSDTLVKEEVELLKKLANK